MNGSFAFTDPTWCSPADPVSRECSLQPDNEIGFYESSSWEYSWSAHGILTVYLKAQLIYRFAPHDTAHLIELMGGNVSRYSLTQSLHSRRATGHFSEPARPFLYGMRPYDNTLLYQR